MDAPLQIARAYVLDVVRLIFDNILTACRDWRNV
jgi:hypothetical protein